MKRKAVRMISVLLFLSMLVMPVGVMAFTPDKAAKEAYEKNLKEAKQKKAELEAARNEASGLIELYSEQKSNIEKYITELDIQLNDYALRIFELQEEIADTEKELEKTQKLLEEARLKEAEQYETMKARVQYIYENGETGYLDVFFNSGSLSDVLNQLEYVTSIQEYDNSLLERYEAARQDVADREAALTTQLETLNTMREQEEFERSTIDELYALKAAEIEAITEQLGLADEYLFTYIEEISNTEVEIDKIIADEEKRVAEEERKRLEEEERLRKEEEARRLAEQRAAEAAKKNTGTKVFDKDAIKYVVQTDETDPYEMIWPLPGDHRTYSKFGYRKAPTKGASTYHQGWDIGGEFGASIVSVLAGTAIEVSYNSSAGNYVKVEHESGFVTVYCHMSKQLVKQGDYVKQGQVIGLVGSTGVSTGPHLHFAVKKDGTYIDPDPYIGHLE